MFTDSHCHLTYLKLDNHDRNPEGLLGAMKDANVSRAMAIMCHYDEFDDIKAWVDRSDDKLNIGMSVGLHPCQDAVVLAGVTVEKLLLDLTDLGEDSGDRCRVSAGVWLQAENLKGSLGNGIDLGVFGDRR